jgi:immunity protein 35 of polymorphic toxin system
MDAAQATAAARQLLVSSPPGIPDPIALDDVTDHDWCWVVQWTSRRAVVSRDPADAPPPGIGPIAVDKATGEAFYLSSIPLPVALDMARASRHNS